jgi:hypothetical protein
MTHSWDRSRRTCGRSAAVFFWMDIHIMAASHHSISIIGSEQRPRTEFLAPHERVLGSIPFQSATVPHLIA